MGESTHPRNPGKSRPTPAPTGKRSYTFTAVLVVLLVAAAGGYYPYERSKNAPPPDVRAAMEQTFRDFRFAGTSVGARYAA